VGGPLTQAIVVKRVERNLRCRFTKSVTPQPDETRLIASNRLPALFADEAVIP